MILFITLRENWGSHTQHCWWEPPNTVSACATQSAAGIHTGIYCIYYLHSVMAVVLRKWMSPKKNEICAYYYGRHAACGVWKAAQLGPLVNYRVVTFTDLKEKKARDEWMKSYPDHATEV